VIEEKSEEEGDVSIEQDEDRIQITERSGFNNTVGVEIAQKMNPSVSLGLFTIKKKLFMFDRVVPTGQYFFPFKFRLPPFCPDSFKLKKMNNEIFSTQYVIKAYFNSDEPIL
jgi:hypothetical protein